jgi:hypothetical protein
MLKDHGQTGTKQAQLLLVCHLQLAVRIAYQGNSGVVDHNGAFTRLFEEVNTAQKGTFPGTRRANNTDDIARIGVQ